MAIFENILHAITGGKPAATPATTPAGASGTTAPFDVAALLEAKAAQAGQPLNWRASIVDLLKLLSLDSSQHARQELAKELGYTGSVADSAAMNIFLHHQVMTKLAEHGGTVPDELKLPGAAQHRPT